MYDNNKIFNAKLTRYGEGHKSLHPNLSTSTSSINSLITHQSKLEFEVLVSIPVTIQDKCNVMKESIYDDLTKRLSHDLEQSLSFPGDGCNLQVY